MSELVHVQLGGPMAKHFGRHWHLKVRNTKQALDLIEANKPGFKAWMKRNIKTYDRYHIQITNKQGHKWSVDESEYQMMGQSDNIAKIRITPVPRGSGGSAFGLKKGDKLSVAELVEMEVGGKKIIRKKEIGELKITKVEDENFSICEVKSGGIDINSKFKAQAKLQIITKQ